MEVKSAEKLQKKKINKTKLKKTIKNVICRPDPIFWPVVTNDENKMFEIVLSQHKVHIPEFKKPLWRDLQSIPKEKRPKPPKTEKVEGLVFGISSCCEIIQQGNCSAVTIDAAVNPRSIVQAVLESCVKFEVPVLCIDGLKKITLNNFGIPTCCLAVKKEYLLDISKSVAEIGSNKQPQTQKRQLVQNNKVEITKTENKVIPMNVQESTQFQYLYRNNRKTRIFVPSSDKKISKDNKKFTGQDFIKFSGILQDENKNKFKKMIVKRIANNPNRGKVK